MSRKSIGIGSLKKLLIVGLATLLPALVSAQPPPKSLKNPLDPSLSSIPDLLLAILNVVIIIAMPIVALYIIYAGFMYVAAQGNPEKVQEAGRALTFGVIGGVIIVGAVAILAIISNLVAAF